MSVCDRCFQEHTVQNVCACAGHDTRWRLKVGPMQEGERRTSILTCLDCGKIFK